MCAIGPNTRICRHCRDACRAPRRSLVDAARGSVRLMTLAELRRRWLERRDEWRRLGVSVDGARVADEILADLTALDAAGEQALSLTEAARECGYSADHLGRLVRSGAIVNAGRAKAPKIRRCDLPQKPSPFPTAADAAIVSRERIAASVLTLNPRGQDG